MSSKETTGEEQQSSLRVLFITPRLPTGERPGSMAPALRQIESLRRFGTDVTVHDMRGIPVLKYGPAIPRMWSSLGRVDLIHAHFGYCGWIARMQWKCPVVLSFMGDDLLGTPTGRGSLTLLSRFMVQANRLLAPRIDQVIVKSREMAEVIAPVPCHIIPNGVDLQLFQPMSQDDAKRQLGLDQHKTYILFPGDPSNPRKGFALAKAATEEAKRMTAKPLEILALWGRHPDQVPLCMNACDAMWMTSLIEGSPNVVKEAMACNLPVVGVLVGDVGELLHGVSGYTICDRDATALGKHMAETLLGENKVKGREALQALGLGLDQVAQRIHSVYLKALKRVENRTDLKSKNGPTSFRDYENNPLNDSTPNTTVAEAK